MQAGLQLLLRHSGSGLVLYHNVFPNVYIGQTGGTVFRSSFPLEEPGRVASAYLELGLSVPPARLGGFALTVNGITLTREFKPSACSSMGDRLFCKMVFDVTPVVKSKRPESLNVEVEHRGMHEAGLGHLGLLLLVGHESASSELAYYSGALSLPPGASHEVKIPEGIEAGEARLVAYIPHAAARLVVENGGSREELGGTGFAEYTVAVRDGVLRLVHEGPGSYYPHEIVVSSILLYRMKAPEPRVEARLVSVESGAVEVEVANAGGAEVANLVVVAFSRGVISDRVIIDKLAPGEAKRLRLKAPGDSIIRIIWRHLDRTVFRELRPHRSSQ